MQLTKIIDKLINFDTTLLINTLKKEPLDKEKANLIRKHLAFFYNIKNQKLDCYYAAELFVELSEELEICKAIATTRGLDARDLL